MHRKTVCFVFSFCNRVQYSKVRNAAHPKSHEAVERDPEMHWKDILKLPSSKLLLAGIVAGVILMAVAVGGYHASGSPLVCGTCHSMDHVYMRWHASNHKQFACTECHLRETHIIGKLAYKTRQGLNDLYHETLKIYPAAISISAEGRKIANGNCLRCHFSTVQNTPMGAGGADCIKCHRFSVHQRGLEKGGGIILEQK